MNTRSLQAVASSTRSPSGPRCGGTDRSTLVRGRLAVASFPGGGDCARRLRPERRPLCLAHRQPSTSVNPLLDGSPDGSAIRVERLGVNADEAPAWARQGFHAESTPTMGRLAQAALIFLNSNAHVAEAVVHSVVNGVPRAPSVAFLALPRDSGRGAASRRRRPWAPLRNARLGHRPHLLPGVPACSCSGLTALWGREDSRLGLRLGSD